MSFYNAGSIPCNYLTKEEAVDFICNKCTAFIVSDRYTEGAIFKISEKHYRVIILYNTKKCEALCLDTNLLPNKLTFNANNIIGCCTMILPQFKLLDCYEKIGDLNNEDLSYLFSEILIQVGLESIVDCCEFGVIMS